MREESNKRFEEARKESNKRFEEAREESNKRFEEAREESNKRFEEIDKKLDMHTKRFEAMDRRFEEAREESNRRFEKIDEHFEKINTDMKDHRDFVNLLVGGTQRRVGRNLENTTAGTLRFALNRKDIKPESLKLRQKIIDTEGEMGVKGREYEYDLLASNGKFIIFEIKSTPKKEGIERFADKCNMAIKKLNLDANNVEKVIISLEKSERIGEICENNGITLV